MAKKQDRPVAPDLTSDRKALPEQGSLVEGRRLEFIEVSQQPLSAKSVEEANKVNEVTNLLFRLRHADTEAEKSAAEQRLVELFQDTLKGEIFGDDLPARLREAFPGQSVQETLLEILGRAICNAAQFQPVLATQKDLKQIFRFAWFEIFDNTIDEDDEPERPSVPAPGPRDELPSYLRRPPRPEVPVFGQTIVGEAIREVLEANRKANRKTGDLVFHGLAEGEVRRHTLPLGCRLLATVVYRLPIDDNIDICGIEINDAEGRFSPRHPMPALPIDGVAVFHGQDVLACVIQAEIEADREAGRVYCPTPEGTDREQSLSLNLGLTARVAYNLATSGNVSIHCIEFQREGSVQEIEKPRKGAEKTSQQEGQGPDLRRESFQGLANEKTTPSPEVWLQEENRIKRDLRQHVQRFPHRTQPLINQCLHTIRESATPDARILNVSQAHDICGVSRQTIHNWHDDAKAAGKQFGESIDGELRFSLQECLARKRN
jgi:hypothetical protein